MIDVATRTIAAAVLRPTTKAVDASLLLARSLTPEPMRPGWAEALRMSRSVLPYQRLVDVDKRLEHAAARPVIVPQTIVCDHGMVHLSQTFRTACRAMGINFQATHPGSPWEKGIVERSFDSVATCSRNTLPATSGEASTAAGRTPTRTPCGRCPSCRTCSTSGSSRIGRTAHTMGCGTHSHQAVR
jgi:transposase InsO family protein